VKWRVIDGEEVSLRFSCGSLDWSDRFDDHSEKRTQDKPE
jgi:hypothetical protein